MHQRAERHTEADFWPQAGAKHVYGIERSAIADQAALIVKDNGYDDRVTIIKGANLPSADV